jgi:cold shock CspA family protein
MSEEFEFYPRGVIVAWHSNRGFGFIRVLRDPTDPTTASKEMPTYFFHFSDSELVKETIHTGMIVDFDIAPRGIGYKATNLIPVQEIIDFSQ